MDATKPNVMVRPPSASASALGHASTPGRTPYERILDALALGRRGQMLRRLARHDRADRSAR